MTHPATAEFARRLAAVEARLDQLSTPQLAHSTIEGGAVRIRDDDGTLTSLVGRQYDGTFGSVTVWGPTPPKPSVLPGNLTVTPIAGGLRVRYDGGFDPAVIVSEDPDVADTPAVAPQDFARFEVHADETDTFTGLLWLTLRRTIESARGGEVEFGVPQDTDVWIRLVSRTTAGRITASDVVGPFQAGKVAEGDIDIDFSVFGGTTVYYGDTLPGGVDPDWNYGDLFLVETDPGPPARYQTYRWYPDDTWKLLEDQGANDALAAAILAQQAADTKAKVFHQDDEPVWTGADGSAIWYDTNDGNRIRVWDGTDFIDRRLGNGSIEPASLIASDLIATGTVTATLLEAILVLASIIVAGNPTGAHVKISELGIETFNIGPAGEIQRTGGWGTGEDGFGLINDDGETTVGFDRLGGGTVETFSVAGVDADADEIIDGGLTIYGREFLDYLADSPVGGVASGFYASAAGGVFASGITTRFGLGEISFTQVAGRQYLIIFAGLHVGSTVSGDRCLFSVRATTDGSTPTISNGTVLGSSILMATGSNTSQTAPPIITYGSFAAGATVRLLVTLERLSGSGSLTAYTYFTPGDAYAAPFRFFAIDMGRDIPDTYIPNDGGGVRAGGNPSANPKKTYTSTWASNFTASYYGNDAKRNDTSDLYQGQTPYYVPNGNQKALAGFTGNAISGETSKTITAALAGATISKVEVYLYCNHSHYNWGGRGIIGYHGNTSAPATAPSATYNGFGTATFGKGAGRWITLPSSTHASWASGTYRGVTVGPGASTAADYYMRFTGTGSQRPKVRITYTR